MKSTLLSSILLLACLPSLAEPVHSAQAPTVQKKAFAARPQGPALIVFAGPESGAFAPGDVSTYRVVNASSSVSLGPIHAKVGSREGFKVARNGCQAGLAPRQSCKVSVLWSPTGPKGNEANSELVVTSSDPVVEARSSLYGMPR